MTDPQILILNVHSALNLGDDGIMRATLALLRQAYPDAGITVAANDPDSWRKYSQLTVLSSMCNWAADCRLGHFRKGIARVPLYLLGLFISAIVYRLFGRELLWASAEKRALLRAYYESDLVLSCGGGNFYAHRPVSPAFFWALMTIGFGVALGKRVVMLPQSIGPIEGGVQVLMARLVLGRVSTILLREELSAQYVEQTLRLTSTYTDVLPDLAFALDDVPSALDIVSTASRKPCLGVSLLDRQAQDPGFQHQGAYEEAILSLIAWWTSSFEGRVYLFAQCYGPSDDQDDRLIVDRIRHRLTGYEDDVLILDTFDDSLALKAAYKAMDVVVATRMHAAIFALSVATPVVVIGYQPKSLGMITKFELEAYYCHINDVTSDRLVDLAQQVMDNVDNIRSQIRGRYEKLKAEAEATIAFLER